MTEVEDENITYDNFQRKCPLIPRGWKSIRTETGITLTLYTHSAGIPIEATPEGICETLPGVFAQEALVGTCESCIYAHRRSGTRNVCFSTEAIPEELLGTLIPVAAIEVTINDMS
ncbi:hypothetical protein A2Y99_05215 [Candidatus Gottesmanbacteria bacterium RBG_13_37_7]|uniref:Uncharacterized protein n=1 Tax=Candidatus Gottesmanbacteria bacterium RBG_13_37_7 TaxID=1798369 RepID=A0A1F5YH66_9BACT|nr:MAG: hypothetical protein A2Y99_05215 [Candidatus Gottesmanbacteria bacterium RBG_13_37_7]